RESTAIVTRPVFLVARVHKFRGLILKHSQWRHSSFQCRGINERLEHRTWLSPSIRGPVELRLGVVSTANHGQDRSRLWGERDQRCLRPQTSRLVTFVQTIELVLNRVRCKSLQIEIKRGE